MARYIDADAAIEYLEIHKELGKKNHSILCADEDSIIKFLQEKCPTADVVEVVRCKDCKYWVSPMKDDAHYCNKKSGLVGIVAEEDFCSYGERKEQ